MRVKVFTLAYSTTLGGFDEAPLSEFIRDKEVLAVRDHFFEVAGTPHLTCVVTWKQAPVASAESETTDSTTGTRQSSKLPSLDEPQRVLFDTLRDWRKSKAHEDGVPPYVVFTNRQLALLARNRPATPNALATIEGIGPKKIERYGHAVIALVRPDTDATPTKTNDDSDLNAVRS